MTVDEMVKKVDADLSNWIGQIGMVVCVARRGLGAEKAMAACAITAAMADVMITQRKWLAQALEVVREAGTIPPSCESQEAMCHAMAHCLADECNNHLAPPPGCEFDCTSFSFMPAPAFGDGPRREIKFSHN